MPYTLYETMCQVDPFVRLNDGANVRTVQQILFSLDPSDPTEYVLGTDESGRFVISRLDDRGYVTSPPAFIEERVPTPGTDPADSSNPNIQKVTRQWFA